MPLTYLWYPVFLAPLRGPPYLGERVNQYQWTFLDNAARRHTLGIAHGARSGNLVVHCNAQIVKIDFSVLEPKTYSFFVEEELCHLAIEGTREEGFQYNFHIDTEADTPVNRERNLRRVSSRRRGWLALAGLILFIGGILGGVTYFGWSSKQAELQRDLYVTGVPASAKLLPNGAFEFVGGSQVVLEPLLPRDAARLHALGGETLAATGEVTLPVRFYTDDPEKFVLDWRAIFAEVEAGKLSASTTALLAGLAPALPVEVGLAECALRAAGAPGSFRNQLSLIDAYALGREADRRRWAKTVQTTAYREALKEACP